MSVISDAQLAANRSNAQFSTGPCTVEGKTRSSVNAVKTGLTGHTVLLPTEDAAAFEAHLNSYQSEYSPVGHRETELVQSLAESAWRIARIFRLESAIYATGRVQFVDLVEAEEDPATRASLLDLQTTLHYEKQLRNLHTQEARLLRRRDKDLAELRQSQDERLAAEQEALEALAQLHVKTPGSARTEWNGFEFPTAQIKARAEEIERVNRAMADRAANLNARRAA